MARITRLHADTGAPRKLLKSWKETLPVRLSDEKIDEERARACEMFQDYERIEIEKKAASDEYAKQLKKLREKLSRSVAAAQSGEAQLEVTVEEFLDEDGEVLRIRKDTGEIIASRRATDVERHQESFEFE